MDKKPFSKLTKAEQRVLIVKDTLKWIKRPAVSVKDKNGYFDITKGGEHLIIGTDLNKHLGKINCTVCAKGALFLSHVDRFDNCKIVAEDFNPGHPDQAAYDSEASISERLHKHFSFLQLSMIEAAFEKDIITDHQNAIGGWNEKKHDYAPTELGKACILFGKQFRSPVKRLEAILKNIVKNKGEFKPEIKVKAAP